MISHSRQRRVDYERRRMAHHDAVSLSRDSYLDGLRAGLVEVLIEVLQARGFSLSDEMRGRIDDERNLARLKDWIARAAPAASVEDVLNG